MERIVTGCYICKHSMWDSEGCFCKLNEEHPLAPSIGCDRQEVEEKPDINSSYPEQLLKKSNQLDDTNDAVPEGFHRTPFGLMPNSLFHLFHPDNDYLKEDASREQIIEFANATADDVEKLKDFIYNDEDPEGYSHYKLVKETAQRVFDLNLKLENYVEEYDAVLKTHGDTLEEHLDRICNLEHLYEQLISKLCAIELHNGSNFCGNCTHVNKYRAEDGIYACELSGEIVDPDSASCSMFEPPF